MQLIFKASVLRSLRMEDILKLATDAPGCSAGFSGGVFR